MTFIRIGDETIRLDLVTHIKEGCKEETYYGRSVRKTTDHRHGWLEVHFVSGEVLKIEGEGANILRQILDDEIEARPGVPRKFTLHPGHPDEPAGAQHDHAAHTHAHPHPSEEHRPGFRNGLGH